MGPLSEMISLYKKLSTEEKIRLDAFVHREAQFFLKGQRKLIEDIREQKHANGLSCPHCESTSIIRFGHYKVKGMKRQRYSCKGCNQTFCDTTNTILYRTQHAGKWTAFLECTLNGMSLRKAAEQLNVHHITLFYWRHKLLQVLDHREAVREFHGITEMDETYFQESKKGARSISDRKPRKRGTKATKRGISSEKIGVLVVRDREKQTFVKALCRGRMKKKDLHQSIGNKISSRNVLCTDEWNNFIHYFRNRSIPHYIFPSKNPQRSIQGIYHIQNVNNFHSRLKTWMHRFKGVATRYLNHYLSWFHYLDSIGFEVNTHTIGQLAIQGCVPKSTLTIRCFPHTAFTTV